MEFLFGAEPAEAASWRCSKPEELGGPIGDVGSHCLYMAEYLTGSVIRDIRCVYLPGELPIKAEQGAHIKFTLASGAAGSARAAFDRPRGGLTGTLGNLGFEVYGSEKSLRTFGTLFQLSGTEAGPVSLRAEIDTGTAVTQVKPDELPNIYGRMISVHAESVISGKRLDLKEGIRNLALILKCHESARKGGIKIDVPMEEKDAE
jgi:predicted dehydrogenase